MKQYLAIDIGGTSVKLGLVDETGGILAKACLLYTSPSPRDH